MAATTAMIDFTAAARAIGSRTNAAGAAVDDLSAEEDRLIHTILTEGALADAAFLVQAHSGMTVRVGSGVAKADRFVLAGDAAGQENYIVRLDVTTIDVTASAADPSLARTDEVWLVVADGPYDSGSLALPRIGYRKGDPGGGAPGPDAAWKAAAKLASLAVAAGATSIAAGNITDERAYSYVRPRAATVEWTAEAAAPTGALLCDGSAVSRTTYRRLFRLIGTAFGVGDGSTTFNLPNLKGKVPVGKDASQTEFDTLGETGGAKTHTLATSEMPAHTHTGTTSSDGSHQHGFSSQNFVLEAQTGATQLVHDFDAVAAITDAAGTHSHTMTTASTGGGGAHNNLQPYIVLNPIIWT